MSQSDIVESALDGEPVAARVDLGGEDRLLVTPTRTLLYRAEGLLSDESIEGFSHDAERVSIAKSRRKAKVTLDYGLDGERTFTLPSSRLEEGLHPVLAGILNAAGITDAGETVKQTFRFSELTLVVTSDRVVKHIGTAVWDDEYEEFHYDDVTDLTFEEGSVATSVVLEMDDRQERFKAPNEDARRVIESLEDAVLAYYDVSSLAELQAAVAPTPDADRSAADSEDEADAFGDGPDPLSANPAELADEPTNGTRGGDGGGESAGGMVAESVTRPPGDASNEAVDDASDDDDTADADTPEAAGESPEVDGSFEGSGFESAAAVDEGDIAAELAELRSILESQNDRLDRQQDLIEQLVEELRRGR